MPSRPQTFRQWLLPRDDREDAVVCLHCGYSLEGLGEVGNCPECGEGYARKIIPLIGASPERCSEWRQRLRDCEQALEDPEPGHWLARMRFRILTFLLHRYTDPAPPFLRTPSGQDLRFADYWREDQPIANLISEPIDTPGEPLVEPFCAVEPELNPPRPRRELLVILDGLELPDASPRARWTWRS